MSAGFHSLKIVDVAAETADALTLTLEPPADARDQFAFTPGQHLTVRAVIDGEDIWRNYSICSAADGSPIRIAIKKADGGRFSTWAAATLAAGASIEATPPRGHFTWTFEPGARRHYLAFAAGSGVTPVLSLIRTGLAAEPHSRFTLLYGNRTSSSIMFLEELASLKDRYLDQLQVLHFLTAERDEIDIFNGRLDAPRIAEVLSSLIEPASIDVAFICGPEGLMTAAEAAMLAAGLARDHVLVERFTVGRPSDAEAMAERTVLEQAQGRMIEATLDGRTRRIAFDPRKGGILDNVRAAGLPAPFACKAGVCATCRARLTAGEVQMAKNYGLTEEELAQGYILTCQAAPLTDEVVVNYDR